MDRQGSWKGDNGAGVGDDTGPRNSAAGSCATRKSAANFSADDRARRNGIRWSDNARVRSAMRGSRTFSTARSSDAPSSAVYNG